MSQANEVPYIASGLLGLLRWSLISSVGQAVRPSLCFLPHPCGIVGYAKGKFLTIRDGESIHVESGAADKPLSSQCRQGQAYVVPGI